MKFVWLSYLNWLSVTATVILTVNVEIFRKKTVLFTLFILRMRLSCLLFITENAATCEVTTFTIIDVIMLMDRCSFTPSSFQLNFVCTCCCDWKNLSCWRLYYHVKIHRCFSSVLPSKRKRLSFFSTRCFRKPSILLALFCHYNFLHDVLYNKLFFHLWIFFALVHLSPGFA